MSETDHQVYISVTQLAERYDVSVATIWRWSTPEVDRLPRPVRLASRTTRWRKDEVEAYESKHRKEAPKKRA